MLADLGAEVVKVERPEVGDDTRAWGPPFVVDAKGEACGAAYYHCCNRGKRSLAIDFESEDGRATIRRLAGECDVVIENFKVGGLKKFGLDAVSLRAAFPEDIGNDYTSDEMEGQELDIGPGIGKRSGVVIDGTATQTQEMQPPQSKTNGAQEPKPGTIRHIGNAAAPQDNAPKEVTSAYARKPAAPANGADAAAAAAAAPDAGYTPPVWRIEYPGGRYRKRGTGTEFLAVWKADIASIGEDHATLRRALELNERHFAEIATFDPDAVAQVRRMIAEALGEPV